MLISCKVQIASVSRNDPQQRHEIASQCVVPSLCLQPEHGFNEGSTIEMFEENVQERKENI